MELVRIVRKSLLCIVCLFIAMICISLYQINYNQDSKVYKYYKEIIADYNNIKITTMKDIKIAESIFELQFLENK